MTHATPHVSGVVILSSSTGYVLFICFSDICIWQWLKSPNRNFGALGERERPACWSPLRSAGWLKTNVDQSGEELVKLPQKIEGLKGDR